VRSWTLWSNGLASGTSPAESRPPEIALLLRAIDLGYDTAAWHGPSLRASVHRVPVNEAVWRPAPDQRNIWEITVHSAYWKYVVWRRLTGEKRGSFGRKGSDWFVCPPADAPEATWPSLWREDLALLEETHRKMHAVVAALTVEQLHAATTQTPWIDLITGIASHDVYHAGQVQTLRQLYRHRTPTEE